MGGLLGGVEGGEGCLGPLSNYWGGGGGRGGGGQSLLLWPSNIKTDNIFAPDVAKINNFRSCVSFNFL